MTPHKRQLAEWQLKADMTPPVRPVRNQARVSTSAREASLRHAEPYRLMHADRRLTLAPDGPILPGDASYAT
ncbi:hypothetical protein BN2476_90147 [Paraburkholderia piptadeniae]|uniref:Uncharacterized protein n=1 Tax=Paraburkholderia piptadeniae TaxID=1701573 RepID=A0A1N7RN73_9BURK|nr:hypothetical protein BN2476_90147 [Paraburkholderia piptadeniae]